MIGNFIIGILIALTGITIFKGDETHEDIHENGRHSSSGPGPGSKRVNSQEHNRASLILAQKKEIEQLKLNKARLDFKIAKINQRGKKHEHDIKKQPATVGGVAPNHPGTESDRPDGQTTIEEVTEK